MTAPAYASSGTYRATTGSTGSFAVPSGVVADDIVIVVFYLDVQATTVTAMPSGFAHLDGSPVTSAAPFNHSLIIAGKRATGADAGTYDFTFSGSQYHEGQAHRFTGVTTSGAFVDTPSGTATSSASSNTTPAVSMTTLGADRLVLHCATCWAGGTWTAPAGYTKRQQGGAGLSTLADVSQAAAGSTGSITATISNADKRAAWIGALIPVPSALTTTISAGVTQAFTARGALGTSLTPGVTQSLTARGALAGQESMGATAGLSLAGTVTGGAAPETPPSWNGILGAVNEARAEHRRHEERRRHPVDCPDHLWPLQPLGGNRYHCQFGGHVIKGC